MREHVKETCSAYEIAWQRVSFIAHLGVADSGQLQSLQLCKVLHIPHTFLDVPAHSHAAQCIVIVRSRVLLIYMQRAIQRSVLV